MPRISRWRVRNRGVRQDETEILFFTCATGIHENFVIPYTYFAETHNPGSRYEFIVEDEKRFLDANEHSIAWLRDNLGVEMKVRSVSEVSVLPHMANAIRFVVEPEQVAHYVYIGDVDIIVLESLLDYHRPVFDAGLPYSNVVRPGTRRLTGLHFADYSRHYPLGEIDDLVKSVRNDEELLYRISERRGLLYDSEVLANILERRSPRPVHGVHMSLNRYPFWDRKSRPDWELTYGYAERAVEILETEQFASFFETLQPGPRLVLANLYFLTTGVVSAGESRFQRYTQQVSRPAFSEGYR